MASAAKQPQPTDSRYLLPNGNYDQDAYLNDYYAWLNKANAIPGKQQASMFKSKEDRPEKTTGQPVMSPDEPPTGGHYANGAWVSDDTVNDADLGAPQPAQASPPKKEQPKADAQGRPSTGDHPWWETEADASATASGQKMGGEGSPAMPDDWLGEINNFREADQKRIKDKYAAGVPDNEFRDQVHNARQDRYDTYAHGYDYADKDQLDDDPHSAANAAFFEDPSWLDEVDTMSKSEQQRYMRALQAADPESAQTVLDESRKRKGQK